MGSRIVEAKILALTCIVAMGLGLAARAHAGSDWNDGQIAWKGYEIGLAEGKAQNKPICLVFYTEWCPHCTRYSQVFKDPALVELSKKFVMIRVERRHHLPELDVASHARDVGLGRALGERSGRKESSNREGRENTHGRDLTLARPSSGQTPAGRVADPGPAGTGRSPPASKGVDCLHQ